MLDSLPTKYLCALDPDAFVGAAPNHAVILNVGLYSDRLLTNTFSPPLIL